MAWRIVQQPNGWLARYSDVVDHFTNYNMGYKEAMDACKEHSGMGEVEANSKIMQGIVAGQNRFNDCIRSIRAIHGDEEAERAIEQAMKNVPEKW